MPANWLGTRHEGQPLKSAVHASLGTALHCFGRHEDEVGPACLSARNMAKLFESHRDVPLQDEKMGRVEGQLKASVDWEAVMKMV